MSGRNEEKGKGNGKGRGRVKRQVVEGEDGWRVITHGMKKLNVKHDAANGKEREKKKIAGQLPGQIVKNLTLDKLIEDFRKLQDRWEGTAVSQQIDELAKKQEWHIETAVCIGIGSFSRDWEHRWRSLWQLVLFLDVVKQGGKESGVKMYAQDPAFTPLDKDFLKYFDITTLDSGIEEHITRECFVFSPFVDWFVLLPTFLADRDLAVYVGNEVLGDYGAYAQGEDKKGKLGECNELGTKFLEGREMVRVKDFECHAYALNGMVVYYHTSTTDKSPLPT